MTWGAVSNDYWAGDTRLAESDAKAIFTSEARAGSFLWVELEPPRPAVRGRLSLFIEGAIERALDARGAPPPAYVSGVNRSEIVADQVRRAVVSGTAGIALWLSSLEGIAGQERALDVTDSAALRWWIRAASEQPIRLGFEAANQRLGVYLEPRTLESLLAGLEAEETAEDELAEAVSFVQTEDDALPLEMPSEMPPEMPAEEATDRAPMRESASVGSLAESARAMAEEIADDSDTGWLRHALIDLSTPEPQVVKPPEPVVVAAAVVEPAAVEPAAVEPAAVEPAAVEPAPEPIPEVPEAPKLALRFAEEPEAPPAADIEAKRKLEVCWRELSAATGPRPLSVVERLFSSAYMPLRAALDRGLDMPVLRDTTQDWSQSFEKSYRDGFDALRIRNKRPAMVVDVPDIALRVARLHGARSTQLLLVDSMRFDIGNMVNEKIHGIVGKRAACAERFLLWAALPTTTTTQVELIGRGPAGLRDPIPGASEELIVGRGRKAQMIRRLKTGQRELLKLDIVAARLAEPHGEDPNGFESVADEVAQRIAAHFEGLQPRTLVMIFGDHGFAVDVHADGRRSLTEGGASPEEVLVPAFAWLVGAVH